MTPEERAERAIYGLVLMIREARATAYEDAARIAEKADFPNANHHPTAIAIADAIRARAQEGG